MGKIIGCGPGTVSIGVTKVKSYIIKLSRYIIYTVTYEGADHTVTIPAGTAKAEDGVEYYGPAWLIATYGENGASNPSGTYIVQPGDTLTKIAAVINTTTNDLVIKNNIQNQDLIYAGQIIRY